MSSLPDWLIGVKTSLPGWIDRLAHSDGPGRYCFAADAYEPYDIHSSNLMRAIIFTTGGGIQGLPTEKQRKQWAEYFLSFQRPEDGLLVDPAVERHILGKNGQPTADEIFGIRHMLTRNVINCSIFLGGKPRYRMAHQECFQTPEEIVARLERLNWHNPWGAGSWAGAAIHFQRFNLLLGDERAEAIIRAALDWLVKRQDPATGAWSDGKPGIPLHTLINGIFKVWIQLIPFHLPVQYPEKVIDLCIRGLHEDPHLGHNPDACSIFDVALVLDIALRYCDHRREEVRALALKHLPLIEPMVRPDCAFTYGPDPLVRSSNLDLAPLKDQGDVLGTALNCQAVALLANLGGLRKQLGWVPTTEALMGLARAPRSGLRAGA